jgi:hypothetical protein
MVPDQRVYKIKEETPEYRVKDILHEEVPF